MLLLENLSICIWVKFFVDVGVSLVRSLSVENMVSIGKCIGFFYVVVGKVFYMVVLLGLLCYILIV